MAAGAHAKLIMCRDVGLAAPARRDRRPRLRGGGVRSAGAGGPGPEPVESDYGVELKPGVRPSLDHGYEVARDISPPRSTTSRGVLGLLLRDPDCREEVACRAGVGAARHVVGPGSYSAAGATLRRINGGPGTSIPGPTQWSAATRGPIAVLSRYPPSLAGRVRRPSVRWRVQGRVGRDPSPSPTRSRDAPRAEYRSQPALLIRARWWSVPRHTPNRNDRDRTATASHDSACDSKRRAHCARSSPSQRRPPAWVTEIVPRGLSDLGGHLGTAGRRRGPHDRGRAGAGLSAPAADPAGTPPLPDALEPRRRTSNRRSYCNGRAINRDGPAPAF